ncbi:MAG TPA: lactate racemase domain-containing protein [Candidatus Hydrogenedentes bacterium]|nr:lactate racemase domain-containing protein [Candidatus Hydrogenedentota bacterium]
MVYRRIADNDYLSDKELYDAVKTACAQMPVDGKRVLFIIPDQTRSMPMPLMFRALYDAVHSRASSMDYLIALGTHPPMSDAMIQTLLDISAEERSGKYSDIGIYNHAWQDPNELVSIGTISADEIERISGGLMRQSVNVAVNKRVLQYDVACIVGPVFPHEVVGFSGGYKYFFPGVSGADILNLFHWLGALITNYVINGTKNTPVREVVNKAASLIPVEKWCFCLTVVGKKTKALFFGAPEEAWSEAADLSAQTHIIYKDKPFKSILAMAPPMYDELWTAGKCMYKLEPVVADGGELIIFGEHVTEVSVTHGHLIKKIGYHTRDYFTKQMDRFRDIPGGILAHSTHVRGGGTFENSVEKPRVQVTLATGIPEAECRAINLGYRDPKSINPDDWKNREEEGYLLVPDAGEILYRLKG